MTAPKGSIAFVPDDRLSRERLGILNRAVTGLRSWAKVDTFPATITEDELLAKLELGKYQLVLVPWYRYMAWTRVEAFYGLTRTSGPTFAGYFCEALQPYEIGQQAEHLRSLIFDFCYLQTSEIVHLVRTVLTDSTRTGILPHVDARTSVYCENWHSRLGQGTRADTLLGLPEIEKFAWQKRATALRICLQSFWSLVYDEGPGKSESSPIGGIAERPKAYFQVAIDSRCLVMRLFYNMQHWTPKNTLSTFWPNAENPISPAQLLLRYADFVKVHTLIDSNDVEIVVGFYPSAPSEKAFGKVHSLWVEPVTSQSISELPYLMPSPDHPQLKIFPTKLASTPTSIAHAPAAQERTLGGDASAKLRLLVQALKEKDETIKELKSGGVTTRAPSASEPELLLKGFQDQYIATRKQIVTLEAQIEALAQTPNARAEREAVNQQLTSLIEREKLWIQQLMAVIEAYKATRKPPKTGT